MLIGVPKEIKDHEYRVGLTPAGVHALVRARAPSRGRNRRRRACRVSPTPTIDRPAPASRARPPTCWAAELVVKVKELQESEYASVRRGQILFAYLHLAPEPELLDALLRSGVSGHCL